MNCFACRFSVAFLYHIVCVVLFISPAERKTLIITSKCIQSELRHCKGLHPVAYSRGKRGLSPPVVQMSPVTNHWLVVISCLIGSFAKWNTTLASPLFKSGIWEINIQCQWKNCFVLFVFSLWYIIIINIYFLLLARERSRLHSPCSSDWLFHPVFLFSFLFMLFVTFMWDSFLSKASFNETESDKMDNKNFKQIMMEKMEIERSYTLLQEQVGGHIDPERMQLVIIKSFYQVNWSTDN